MLVGRLLGNFGSAGGPPPIPDGYIFEGLSNEFAASNANDFTLAQRELSAPAGTSAGDLLLVLAAAPHGSGNVTFLTPTVSQWNESVNGQINISGSAANFLSVGIRLATGDSEDDCRLGSPGSVPLYGIMARFSGDVFTGTPANRFSTTNTHEEASDTGFYQVGSLQGALTDVLTIFAATKENTDSDDGSSVGSIDQGIITLSTKTIEADPTNNIGLYAAWGYTIDESLQAYSDTNWGLSPSTTENSLSICAKLRSSISS